MIRVFWIIAITTVGFNVYAQTASQTIHTIGRGDSLYGIVAQYYPDRLARWTNVAADIVALNPDAFPEGLDSVMRLGDELVMVDYDTPTPTADSTTAPQSASATPSATPVDNAGASAETTNEPESGNPNVADTEVADGNTERAIGRVMAVNSAIAIDQNNQQRPLDVNDVIYLGDAVSTGPYSSVTITMLDRAEFDLQPSSRLMFEHYQYVAQSQRGSAVMTLVKGGFNARTGLLGQQQPSAVTVNTAVATVTVRDTRFALHVCAPDSCRVNESSDYLDAGLYTGVIEGTILLSNNTGDRESRRGEFLHVAAPNTMPETAIEAASLLFSSSELALLNVAVEKEQPLSFLGWLKRKLFGD